MRITIKGRVASKKNAKQVIKIGKRMIPVSSKAWKRYEKEAIPQVKQQYKSIKPLKPNYDVCFVFYVRGRGNIDLDNLISGVMDILQKSGVIENDRHVMSLSADKIIGAKEYITDIEITTL